MLTGPLKELLMFIHDRQQNTGITPSYEEMRIAIGLKSKSGIHQRISSLVERGYLRRMSNRARALEVLKLPENISPQEMPDDEETPEDSSGIELPFLGRIAAGVAIEAIEYVAETLSVPESLIGRGKHFVLEISGDSMIDAGIHDGDYVVIRQQNTANNGQIVVACIDNEEVTLKRFQSQGSTVALKPENTEYQTQIYGGERISIKGILAGLIRYY